MIKCISVALTNYLLKHNTIDEEHKSFYQYGLEITLSTALNIILILVISAMLGTIIEGAVFLCIFISLRHLTGGYHANTYFACNFWLSVCYIILESLFHYIDNPIKVYHSALLIALSLFIIVLWCPIENPNKRIPTENRTKLKILAIILATVYETIALLLQVFNNRYGVFILYTVLLVAILVIVATLQSSILERRKKNHGGNYQNNC